MRLVDADKLLKFFTVDTANQTYRFGTVKKQIESAPTVKAVPINKLRNLVNKLQDEKDYAYASFDEYKIDVLGCDDIDDLPNDDYRFGLNRAIELLQLLIAEMEDGE